MSAPRRPSGRARGTAPAVVRTALAAAVGALHGPVAAVLGALTSLVVPRVLARRERARARAVELDALAGLLELAARGVRSGRSAGPALVDAVRTMGGEGWQIPAAGEGRLAERLDDWAGRDGTPAARLVAGAVGVALESSADPSRSFEAAARALRSQRRAAREVDACTAQARASASLLGAAPVVVFGGSLLADPGLVHRVGADPLAGGCIALGLVVELAGMAWMRALVGSVVAEA